MGIQRSKTFQLTLSCHISQVTFDPSQRRKKLFWSCLITCNTANTYNQGLLKKKIFKWRRQHLKLVDKCR